MLRKAAPLLFVPISNSTTRTLTFRSLLLLSTVLVMSFNFNLFAGPVAAQDQNQADVVSVLQVVETTPAEGEELALEEPVTLYFDRTLDCATAQDAFTVLTEQGESVAGEITCDGTALTFTPETALTRGETYTLSVTDAIRAEDGAQLLEPFTLELQTSGFLRVTNTLPTPDSAEVRSDTELTIIFNRPVVPLGVPSDGPDLPNPVTIEPAIEGTFEWLNTSVYTFMPDTAWAGGTEYTVTVEDVEAVDGSVLAEPYTFSFTTISPAVVSTLPTAGATKVRLDTKIQVTFNQPMDQASTEAAFFLRPEETGAPLPPGTFTWNDDGTGFMFEPDDLLALGVVYEFGFEADSAFEVGQRVTLPPFRAVFITVPLPAVISTEPNDGDLGAYPYGFNIAFASPMDPQTITERIVVEPALYDEPEFFYRDWDDSMAVSFPLEPSTLYIVTLEAGAEDIYGNRIDQPFTFSFTTAPYASEINLQTTGGPVGFYDADREKTSLFVTHRNISTLDLQLYSVPLLDFINALSDNQYYSLSNNYAPRPDSLLSAWQIPSVAPENVLRYELLDLGSSPQSGQAAFSGPVSCPTAMPTRTKVGDQAVVTAEPNLRARAFPPNGDLLEQLYPGYAFTITGGPICANDILWWEIRLRDGRAAWVAEGLDEEYFFDVTISAEATEVVVPPIELGGGALPAGIYFLNVTAPEFANLGYNGQRHFMVVADVNIVLKSTIDSAVAWVTDVHSGTPVANQNVTLYLGQRSPVVGTTDADGVVRFEIERLTDLYIPMVALVNDNGHFGLGYSEWADGVNPWAFNINYTYYPSKYSTYMYTERPVYRPGQPVYFRGIVREKDDVTYTVPDGLTSLPVVIYDGNGAEVYRDQVELTPYGSFSDVFTLAEDAALGYYTINVDLPSVSEIYRESASVSFDVAQYRIPEFQVTVNPVEPEVVQGDTIEVVVDTAFFFGGPVANANIEYIVTSNDYYFDRYRGQGRYDFFDSSPDEGEFFRPFGFGGQIASGKGTSDSQGKFVIELPAALKDASQSQTFTLEAIVRDETGQSVAGRRDVTVHQGEFYLGVGAESYVGTADQAMTVNVLSVDWQAAPAPDKTVSYTVVERRWSSVQEVDRATGRIAYSYDVEEIPIVDGEVTTGADGSASFDFVPPNGGVYKATVTTTDSRGNTITASTTMWVSDTDYVAWRISNDRRIELIADRTKYEVGDTAEVLITSPFQGPVEAFITIERGDVLRYERLTMEDNSLVYTLPIDESFAPNVFVGVMLVKGVDASNPVADFRMGMVELQVNNERLELTVDVEPDRELVGPRETVTYTITTTDYEGNPVQAEVGVALTDLASLSVAEQRTGPILDFFYGLQALAVRSSTPLTINTDILTQFTLDVIKGGGGGGGELGIFEIREEFLDTPFWDGSLVTDENGQATVEITLPDNLTTWRLDVRGATTGEDRQMLVGQTLYDLISTKPVLVRPVTPRFFVVGDEVVLASVVNNNTDEDLEVTADLQTDSLTFDGDTAQTATIPAKSSMRFEWSVTVPDVDSVELIFTASANDGEFTDATRPQIALEDGLLPVYRYEAPEIAGTGGVLRSAGGVEEAIVLPQRFDVTQGELTVSLEPSLAAAALEGLDYFENCECESTEATVSKFLPNVATYRALTALNVNLPNLEDRVEFEVNLALQRLIAQQHVDGGWGWFVQYDSDPLVTAYAVIGLVEARDAGFAVDRRMISQAGLYLQQNFSRPDSGLGLSADAMRDRQAFIAYALGKVGLDEISGMSNLFDNRASLSIYAKALLALALHDANPNDTNRLNTLVDDLFADAIISANGAHWEEDGRDYFNWNTDNRTTAIVLKALLTLQPDNELLPNVVRWLMTARKGDAWETTQETAWSLMALTDWMVASGELDAEYQYTAAVNGDTLVEGAATRETITDAQTLLVEVSDLLQDQAHRLLIQRTDGGADDGALYYTAYLRALLPVPEIEPLDRGLVVQRQYQLFSDDSGTPITEAHVGELVQVRLTIIAPNNLYYVVIEDPLPAGAEAVDPSLATAQQTATDPFAEFGQTPEGGEIVEEEDPRDRWLATWYFNNIDFRDEKVVLNATYLPAGTYEYTYTMRPSVEGTFNVIPTTGREFYFPEVFGRGAGSTFTVLPPADRQ